MPSLRMPALLLLLAWPGLAQTAAPTHPVYGTFGFDATGMDRSVKPGDDWLRYATGAYLDRLVIPADRAFFGERVKLSDLSQERSRLIVEAAAHEGSRSAESQKVGDYYASFMDEAGIEAKGLTPLQPELAAIAAIADRAHLAAALGHLLRQGVPVPIEAAVEPDLKNPALMALYLGQGGLGLPDRDYYLEPKFAAIRAKYQVHVGNLLRLAGFDRPEARAQAVLDLETRLATTHWTRVAARQEENRYNPVTAGRLEADYPGLDWTAFFAAAGLPRPQNLVAAQPSALQGTAALLGSAPLAAWQDYLRYHTLSAAAPCLPKAFVEERFAFQGRVLSGQPELAPRWKRGVDQVCEALPEAVGKLYVARYFPPETKKQVATMVKNILSAMDERLLKLTWMDPGTKAQARAKLARFTTKIGYPDTWRDYARLEIRRGDALGNTWRAQAFEFQRRLDKLGRPVDRGEWGMTPMTVNAYANPSWNEIVFAAAILQPPCFDPAADPAVNYGAIGSVIGHELSHHFDDQGRKYDLDGKLSDWWSAGDIARFQALTGQVVRQYAAYEPLPGRHVQGELTLGENMADLAGVNLALDAYHKSLGGQPAPVLDGFTGDQRFFLGLVQMRCMKYRDDELIRRLTTDPHTPSFLRPNVVRNLDAWYAAFGVQPGEKLYLAPEARIRIW